MAEEVAGGNARELGGSAAGVSDLIRKLKRTQCCDAVIDATLGAAIERLEQLELDWLKHRTSIDVMLLERGRGDLMGLPFRDVVAALLEPGEK